MVVGRSRYIITILSALLRRAVLLRAGIVASVVALLMPLQKTII